jgi:hypothetical protein
MKFCILTMNILLALLVTSAYSAEMRLKGVEKTLIVYVEFVGEILPSDPEALIRLIEPYISAKNNFRWIYINSQGGDVDAAMKIGRYLRKLEFDVIVSADAQCLSSCVFLLASGVTKSVLGPNIIGIHRPFGTATGSISQIDANKKYREMSKLIYNYFDEMNIPSSLPEMMLRIPPEQMKMLSFDEIEQFGLNGKDPVAQEIDDAANAERFGVSRQEYLTRRNRALRVCSEPPPVAFDVDCYNAILTGRR